MKLAKAPSSLQTYGSTGTSTPYMILLPQLIVLIVGTEFQLG